MLRTCSAAQCIPSPHSSVVVLHRTTAHSKPTMSECAVVLCSTTTELCGDDIQHEINELSQQDNSGAAGAKGETLMQA